mmetsp:Transcript_66923/g.193427  ORF Transcript_66923/g.193427 Transcript_66923/m.193427 type:complete len:243 (-) Transcript_66923:425-1153(-)
MCCTTPPALVMRAVSDSFSGLWSSERATTCPFRDMMALESPALAQNTLGPSLSPALLTTNTTTAVQPWASGVGSRVKREGSTSSISSSGRSSSSSIRASMSTSSSSSSPPSASRSNSHSSSPSSSNSNSSSSAAPPPPWPLLSISRSPCAESPPTPSLLPSGAGASADAEPPVGAASPAASSLPGELPASLRPSASACPASSSSSSSSPPRRLAPRKRWTTRLGTAMRCDVAPGSGASSSST